MVCPTFAIFGEQMAPLLAFPTSAGTLPSQNPTPLPLELDAAFPKMWRQRLQSVGRATPSDDIEARTSGTIAATNPWSTNIVVTGSLTRGFGRRLDA
jgi:hypothetical protein